MEHSTDNTAQCVLVKCVPCDGTGGFDGTDGDPCLNCYGQGYVHAATTGPKNPHAVALGRKGGQANKGIPKLASAANGLKGGRPKGSKNKPKKP